MPETSSNFADTIKYLQSFLVCIPIVAAVFNLLWQNQFYFRKIETKTDAAETGFEPVSESDPMKMSEQLIIMYNLFS